MRVVIIGSSQSGKSTLFKAITGEHASQLKPGAGINTAIVPVPNEKMEHIIKVQGLTKKVPATIEFADVARVVDGDAREKSSAELEATGKLMGSIRDSDLLVIVLRHFTSQGFPPFTDPFATYENIMTELTLSDLDICTNRIERIEKNMQRSGISDQDKKQLAILKQCREMLETEGNLDKLQLSPEEEKLLRSFSLFNFKPKIAVINTGDDDRPDSELIAKLEKHSSKVMVVSAKIEAELAEIEEEEERRELMADMGITEHVSQNLIKVCYDTLALRTFFTFNDEEIHCWTIKAGDSALIAAGKIHSDLQRGFIRAEVYSFEAFKEHQGDMKKIKAAAQLRIEGKDYEVQDGDILLIRFNV